MSGEPLSGGSPRHVHHGQPVHPPPAPPPHASCTLSAEPLRAMLVDGTAANATIASAAAISLFVFDI